MEITDLLLISIRWQKAQVCLECQEWEYLGLAENTALVPEYRWVWVDVFLLKLRKFKDSGAYEGNFPRVF